MNRDNYNDYSGGFISNWANRSERELIALVAKDVNIAEEELLEKINETKPERYKKELSYWQILSIANVIKHQNS